MTPRSANLRTNDIIYCNSVSNYLLDSAVSRIYFILLDC